MANPSSKAGPQYIELFNQISLHVCSLVALSSSEPASKKRRLDEELTNRPASNGTNGHTKSAAGAVAANGTDPVLLELKDISLVIPQRKKYTLCFTSSHLYARLPDYKEPVAGISYAWSDIGKNISFCKYLVLIASRLHLLPPRPRKDTKTAQLCHIPQKLHNPALSPYTRGSSNPRTNRLYNSRQCSKTWYN